jgi:ubiquinone/menaquinone biosynthesis C-methylase UbiE
MSNPGFKDYFSASAAEYAAFRPKYPAELFDFVASLPERRRAAWDCATGNGQAAVPLAERFDRVVATDASAGQIAHATPHPRVAYGVALADESGLDDASIDLVTVAQALHWLPLDRFSAEVQRVAVPGGALAVWCYTRPVLEAELDAILLRYYSETCGPYWPADRRLVDQGYEGIPLPIDEVAAPPLTIEGLLTLPEFGGYVRTWSATQKLAKAIGRDPVVDVERELQRHWGEAGERRLVRWPVRVRAGRVRHGR